VLVLTGFAKSGNLDGKDGARTGEGSDVDRSGSVSPTKSDRKLVTKKPSFKPVSLNRAFLGEAPATTTAPTSTVSALQSKGTAAPPSSTTVAIKVIVLTLFCRNKSEHGLVPNRTTPYGYIQVEAHSERNLLSTF
jgi:hypothetical protein